MDNLIALDQDFYHQDVIEVAKQLLGTYIRVSSDQETLLAKIIETEAYDFPLDRGSHTYGGKRSPKNEAMYAEGGTAYVYKCYGYHDMMNVVVGPKDIGKAVLIRAVEPVTNIEIMQRKRGILGNHHLLTGGPGKVCHALGINKVTHNGITIDSKSTIALFKGDHQDPNMIVATPRIGMSKHVAESSNWLYRFYIEGNPYVSRPLKLSYNW